MDFADLILVSQVDGVVMSSSPFKVSVDGTLCITGHHLILSSRKEGVDELWLMHQNIDVVERRPSNVAGGSLILKCKDFRIVRLDIFTTEDLNNVATTIESIISVNNILLMCPFFYRTNDNESIENGWTAYRPEVEFSQQVRSDEWRFTYVNKNYEICATYPNVLVVPKNVEDETIIAAARFREGNRFPVLSYRHTTGSVLLRSSQPLVGSLKRCKEDERLLNAVLGPGKRGYIIDTRSQSIITAAKSRGGGHENECNYPQWRRMVKPVERYPALLDCLSKLIEACNDKHSSMDRWSSRFESSNWLSHIKDVLNCACLTAQCLDQENSSVLVHGSEGTDSTLLITSITQVILNPDCRTIKGFEALIEREWLQAGHPFQARHTRGCYSTTTTGRTKSHGATFLLFLDCIYQITYQFACSFEFLPTFLISLYEHSISSQFGTFLANCDADREMLDLSQKTVSLWSHLNKPNIIEGFLNPLYMPNNKIIWPSVAPMSLVLWRDLYLRWVIDLSREKEVWDKIGPIIQYDKLLRNKATHLRKQLMELCKEFSQNGITKRNTKLT